MTGIVAHRTPLYDIDHVPEDETHGYRLVLQVMGPPGTGTPGQTVIAEEVIQDADPIVSAYQCPHTVIGRDDFLAEAADQDTNDPTCGWCGQFPDRDPHYRSVRAVRCGFCDALLPVGVEALAHARQGCEAYSWRQSKQNRREQYAYRALRNTGAGGGAEAARPGAD